LRDYAIAVDTIEERMTADLTPASTDSFRHTLTITWQALRPSRPA
jgi:hypothetical protein